LQRVAPTIVATKEPSPLAVAAGETESRRKRARLHELGKCLPVILSAGADATDPERGSRSTEVDRVNAVKPDGEGKHDRSEPQ
jgi:hypothetical protein